MDAWFPLQAIGDYVGRRAPAYTEIYAKVTVETVRDVALDDGEALDERAILKDACPPPRHQAS